MKVIFFLILLTLLALHNSESEYSTWDIFYSLRVGEKGEDHMVVIDSKKSETILFNNRHHHLQSTGAFTDSVEVNGLYVKDFPFEVEEGSEYSNTTQGILGLGISEGDYSNTLIDFLHSARSIKQKILYLTTKPVPKFQFKGELPKIDPPVFTHCNLTRKDDLEEEYQDGWVCYLSHILIGNSTDFEDTIEIKGRAIFDTRSYFIYAPMEYLDTFLNEYHLNETCKPHETEDNEVLLYCKIPGKNPNYFNSLDSISFIFDGYAYSIPSKSLFFMQNDQEYIFMIGFSKEKSNIWTLGFPFFSEFMISLDYDTKMVGFHGNNAQDFRADWNEWVKNNPIESQGKGNYLVTGIYVVAIVALGILAFIVVFFIIRTIKRRFARQQGKLVEDHN